MLTRTSSVAGLTPSHPFLVTLRIRAEGEYSFLFGDGVIHPLDGLCHTYDLLPMYSSVVPPVGPSSRYTSYRGCVTLSWGRALQLFDHCRFLPESPCLNGGYDDAHRQPREAEDEGVTVEAGPHVCDYGEPQQREEQVLQEVR